MALKNAKRLPTVVTPNPSGAGSTRTVLGGVISQPFAQMTDMTDPTSLLRIINQLASTAQNAAALGQAQHDAGYTLFKSQKFVPGTPVVIAHGLGHSVQGWSHESPTSVGGSAADIFSPVRVAPSVTYPDNQFLVLSFGYGAITVIADVKVW